MATSDSVGGGGGGVHCYYELLEVDRQATEDELKKAYRRLALRWHPDKNPDRVEEATAHFRLVQKAYEILGNSRTRAWYDKHRERILSGGAGASAESGLGDSATVPTSVFGFFPPNCYYGYGDGRGEFFGVYSRVFSQLAEEAAGGGEMPEFGRSDSDFLTTVGPFYSRWEQFVSAKPQQQQQQQQRSEEVRVLVAFVKAWDPRVFAHRADAAATLLACLAESEAVRASFRRSALAGLAVGFGALLGAWVSRYRRFGGDSLWLGIGAAAAGAAYALASSGSFVSLPEALRQMPRARRQRLVEATLDIMGDFNALDTATWASLLATDAAFRARLLAQLRGFAFGEGGGGGGGAGGDAADVF